MKIIIFAGGIGTRMWPLSRRSLPKQFIKMFDGKSGVRFVKTEDLDSADAVYMCSYCVTDSQAAKLKIIAEMQKYKAKK